MDKKTIAFLIAFGPEVRTFVHSGLISSLLQRYNVIIFSLLTDSQAFTDLSKEVKIIQLLLVNELPLLLSLRNLLRFMHGLWLPKLGGQKWNHYLGKQKVHNVKRLLMQSQFLMVNKSSIYLFFVIENILGKVIGTDEIWQRLYVENKVDLVISAGYSYRILPSLQTAKNMGLKTAIIPNSWKEIYTHPHLHVEPTKMLVWTKDNADAFVKYNPWIDKRILGIVGSLHLVQFLSHPKLMHKQEFFARTGLDPKRPYICYTAAAPAAVQNEELIVSGILSAIKEQKIAANPQLLLRLNPMEDGSRFEYLSKEFPGELIIQKPLWEWKPDLDWCCSLPEDLMLWVSTVYYAACNISIPSTVTLEFLAFHKPVINVCYDAIAVTDAASSNKRFWESDFYAEIKDEINVFPAFSRVELLHTLKSLLQKSVNEEPLNVGQKICYEWERHNTIAEIASNIDTILSS
jgi:hypothetical protein